jgi:hypothetical protein
MGVVGRKWQGKDYGPGGNTVFLTNAPVEQPCSRSMMMTAV